MAMHEQALHMMEMQMLQWCLGQMQFDHTMKDNIQHQLRIEPIVAKLWVGRLRWYGHDIRSKEDSSVRTAMCLDSDGQKPHGRLQKW